MRISCDRLREILHYDPETGEWTWRINKSQMLAGSATGKKTCLGYRRIRADGRQYKAHVLAWLYMTGNWPVAQIDHIDTNKENNKWSNLREATRGQNQCNTRVKSNNRCGLKGVFLAKHGRWRASIYKDRVKTHLGYFDSAEDAHAAYAAAALRIHGEFARPA